MPICVQAVQSTAKIRKWMRKLHKIGVPLKLTVGGGKWTYYGAVEEGWTLSKDTGLKSGKAMLQIQVCWMPTIYNVPEPSFHYLQNENNKACSNRSDQKFR